MEQVPKLKFNMSAYRRVTIEHKMNENMLRQKYLSNLQNYKYREDMFKKKFGDIQPHINNHQPSNRIKAQFHILNFSSETKKRLLYQPMICNKASKQISNQPPKYLPKLSSCRSKSFQEFVDRKISNEYENQLKYNERKRLLMKKFDELKHSIHDPHSTFSVLAALSRALLYLESEIKH